MPRGKCEERAGEAVIIFHVKNEKTIISTLSVDFGFGVNWSMQKNG